jgi:hypothetical protein
MAEQQVTLTDLDPQQLQEVKKQLDEVSKSGERNERAARLGARGRECRL